MWQISLGAKAQQTRTSLDDVASWDYSNTKGSDDDSKGEDILGLVKLLIVQKADTEKEKNLSSNGSTKHTEDPGASNIPQGQCTMSEHERKLHRN